MSVEFKCALPRCKNDGYIKYYERWVCESHWDKVMGTEGGEKLKALLGIVKKAEFVGEM